MTSSKQLDDLQKNFQEQQKQRQAEMESYKKEIAILHEKNVQSAINEKTSSLQISLETLKQENVRLNQEVQDSKTNYMKIIIAFLVALVIGFILAKFI
ncbi:hypothetical protein ODZ84_05440 [Chryseobacterium fluminis]|uniref:hypothetical protein n=1 Tax=Chryseobacterium fluminis TaxID=2983606 RepID=UPI00224C7D54|nr:hypothetical protein [Chryseobacterium sp. MMS21-Ot14]UZT99017.1 hypothetical protein ODZ84_05440 [Chryseobacterium sp. MMS21-Ot14]